ncbi:hypothetical protein D3C79_1106240 [compost metagenome]
MIVQVKAVPALAMQRGLPFGEDGLDVRQLPWPHIPFAPRPGINLHQFEVEQHMKLIPVFADI